MSSIEQLNLLDAMHKENPDGIVGFPSSLVILAELGNEDFSSIEMANLLEKYWQPSQEDTLYAISLKGIDILSPPVANILVESILKLASKFKKPIVFKAVRNHVAKALHLAALTHNPPSPLWIEEVDSQCRLMGNLPNRYAKLMTNLEEAGCLCSASSIALQTTGAATKRTVNKLSVYLQEMVTLGLLGRVKENASTTPDRKRGWTYLYYRPDARSLLNVPLMAGEL